MTVARKMADYYSLIKKAVDRLVPNAPRESRWALYERARIAQLTQLRAISPPISETEITCEQLALEEAVRRIEVEAEAAQRARDVRVPALNDLVAAADIGEVGRQTESLSSIVQKEPLTSPCSPNQVSIGVPRPMIVTGTATARLIRYWRWRSLPQRVVR
jgi:hypothetical protein